MCCRYFTSQKEKTLTLLSYVLYCKASKHASWQATKVKYSYLLTPVSFILGILGNLAHFRHFLLAVKPRRVTLLLDNF